MSHKWHRKVLAPTGESVDAPGLALLLVPGLLLRGDLRVDPLVVRHVGSGPGGARPCNTLTLHTTISSVSTTTISHHNLIPTA